MKFLVLPGDGIGPEIVSGALEALSAATPAPYTRTCSGAGRSMRTPSA